MIEAGRLSAWQAAPDAITALRGGKACVSAVWRNPLPSCWKREPRKSTAAWTVWTSRKEARRAGKSEFRLSLLNA